MNRYQSLRMTKKLSKTSKQLNYCLAHGECEIFIEKSIVDTCDFFFLTIIARVNVIFFLHLIHGKHTLLV